MMAVLRCLVIAVAVLILIQIIPYGRDHVNPFIKNEPKWDRATTYDLVQRACFDCHSNRTVWPWYSDYAPVSWLIEHDVDEGRAALNFSEWGSPSAAFSPVDQRIRSSGVSPLDQAVLRGDMPPVQYLWGNPKARLTQMERHQLAEGLSHILETSTQTR